MVIRAKDLVDFQSDPAHNLNNILNAFIQLLDSLSDTLQNIFNLLPFLALVSLPNSGNNNSQKFRALANDLTDLVHTLCSGLRALQGLGTSGAGFLGQGLKRCVKGPDGGFAVGHVGLDLRVGRFGGGLGGLNGLLSGRESGLEGLRLGLLSVELFEVRVYDESWSCRK